jgi:hypothetical protein
MWFSSEIFWFLFKKKGFLFLLRRRRNAHPLVDVLCQPAETLTVALSL